MMNFLRQELKLKDEFLQNKTSRRTMKNLAALAFLPERHVIDEFNKIKENAEYNLDGKTNLAFSIKQFFHIICFSNSDLLVYFEDTYIGRKMSRNRRANPRFSISMWNCFSRVVLNLPRTNNMVEGWHNAFHVSCSTRLFHPLHYKEILAFRILPAITQAFSNS